MFQIFFTASFGLFIIIGLVVAVGQPQSSLEEMGTYHFAVFCIGSAVERKQGGESVAVHLCYHIHHSLRTFGIADTLKLFLQWMDARFIARLHIHAAAIKIADFFGNASGFVFFGWRFRG